MIAPERRLPRGLLPRRHRREKCTDAGARPRAAWDARKARAMSPSALLSAAAALVLAVIPSATTDAAMLAAPAARWAWPLDAPHTVVRPFIAPESRYAAGHRGIDLAGAEGSVVRAPADGVVHFAGIVVDRPVMSLRHPNGVLSSFEPVTTTLAAGTVVRRGEAIGALQSGHCRAPCLHFGVRIDGEYVSPLLFLGGLSRSVLLPTRSPP